MLLLHNLSVVELLQLVLMFLILMLLEDMHLLRLLGV
jgi:hypothetical protein